MAHSLCLTAKQLPPAVLGGLVDEPAAVLVSHVAQIHSLRFLDNPRSPAADPYLVSGSLDGMLCCWEAGSWVRLAVWTPHKASILAIIPVNDSTELDELRFWSFGRDGLAMYWRIKLPSESDSIHYVATPDKLCQHYIGGDGLCAPAGFQLPDARGKLSFDSSIVVASQNVARAEQVDITVATVDSSVRYTSILLDEAFLASLDYSEEDFGMTAGQRDKANLVRHKTGMVMSLHIRKAQAARTPFAPVTSAATTITEPVPEATHTTDGPRHPELDSIRDLLAADAIEHQAAAPSTSTNSHTRESVQSYDANALLLLAGFENGRVYAIQLDINGKPPRWNVCSHASCASEAILSLSFPDTGHMGLACSANSICSACHLNDDVLYAEYKYELPSGGSSACAVKAVPSHSIRSLVGVTRDHASSLNDALGGTMDGMPIGATRFQEGSNILVGAIGGWDGVVRLFDLSSGNAIRSIRSNNIGVYAVDMWCPHEAEGGGEEEEGEDSNASAMVAVGDKHGRLSVYYV